MNIFELVEPTKTPQLNIVDMLASALPIAVKELRLHSLPKIHLKASLDDKEQPTFGHYDSENRVLYVALANRHPVDVLRTLVHELVHHKQNEDGKLTAASGATGSPIEDEAHALAGVIMRNVNKLHPEFLQSDNIELP